MTFTRQFGGELGNLKKQHHGRNGTDGQIPNFIPRPVLARFWTTQKINRILHENNQVRQQRPEIITEHFLGVFSLLVYIDRVDCLESFTDYNIRDQDFPLEERPKTWPDTPLYPKLLKAVMESQWIFFPVTFDHNGLYNQTIGPQHILPIHMETVLKSGNSVTVSKIEIDQQCTTFPKTTFVRKTFDERSKSYYEREREAFNSLQYHPTKHIVTCYGSFKQRRKNGVITYNLILEYADGGNLDELFNSRNPPQNLNEVLRFWRAFIGPLEALYHLQIYHKDSSDQRYQAIHQDLKPENLLVCLGSSGHPFDFILKITDFGFAHTKSIGQDEVDPTGVDSHGGQTYGAPESSHHARYTQQGRNPITTAADIFSMGCVMSDAAAYVAGGQELRRIYREMRVSELKSLRAFENCGHDGCFHNGVEALQAVKDLHQAIPDKVGAFDHVTPQVVHVIQTHMLLRHGDGRWTAKELWEQLTEITKPVTSMPSTHSNRSVQRQTQPKTPPQIERPFSSSTVETPLRVSPVFGSSPMTSSPLSPPSAGPFPQSRNGGPLRIIPPDNRPIYPTGSRSIFTPESDHERPRKQDIPILYLRDLSNYRTRLKHKLPIDPTVEAVILKLRNNLKDRDHVFFIDTSQSMSKFIVQIREAFQELGYVAKGMDSNGIELFFSSDPRTHYTGTTKRLLDRFVNRTWDQVSFEDKFGDFIDKRVMPKVGSRRFIMSGYFPVPKKLSVYIFTDGCWGNEDVQSPGAGGVENPIKRVIDKMQERGVNRTQVMIQFVQFGNSDVGTRNLNYLDKFGEQYGCDFVDTKHVSGNVYEIFIGATSDQIDKMNESPPDPSDSGFPSPVRNSVLSPSLMQEISTMSLH